MSVNLLQKHKGITVPKGTAFIIQTYRKVVSGLLGEIIGEIVGYVVAVETVLIALIGGYFMVKTKKRERKEKQYEEDEIKRRKLIDDRAELRQQEVLHSMELLSANLSLGLATAYAVKSEKTNGAMDAAVRQAEKANYEYSNFVNSVAASEITQISEAPGRG